MTHPHEITDPRDRRKFILGGKAKFTLVSKKTGTRFTYKVRQKTADDGSVSPFFVSVLNGPDNWDNYQYIGFIPAAGDGWALRAGKKGHPNAPSFLALDWFLVHIDTDKVEFWHEGSCGRCGRLLTVPTSIESGFGPTCAALM